MGFWEKAGKAASFIADDMASTARRASRDSKHFNDEQRAAYSQMENNLRNISDSASNWGRYDKKDEY